MFAAESLAGIEAESQELPTAALVNSDKVPSSIEALAFVHSSCCKWDSLSSSCCSCCSRRDRKDMLSTIDSYSGAGELVGEACSFRKRDWAPLA